MNVRNHVDPDSLTPTLRTDTAVAYDARVRDLRARLMRMRSKSWTAAATARPPGPCSDSREHDSDNLWPRSSCDSHAGDSQDIDGGPMTSSEIARVEEVMQEELTPMGTVRLSRTGKHHG